MIKKKGKYSWADAKKKCRLNQADIQMAKELGMTPKSLIKNIPNPSQKWKAPVKVWVKNLYEDKFGQVLEVNMPKPPKRSNRDKQNHQKEKNIPQFKVEDDDLPF